MSSASSDPKDSWLGLSLNRTFFDRVGVVVCLMFVIVDDGRPVSLDFRVCARAKSSSSSGSLGEVKVDDAEAEASVDSVPWNCRDSSLYWVRSCDSCSVSEDRVDSDSIPSRNDSSDRDMLESVEGLGSSFSEMALCRSRRESLMWSARRRSCDGFDMVRERLEVQSS